MKKFLVILILLIACPAWCGIVIKNPYANGGGNWYTGNLHSHTTQSDGSLSAAALKKAYDDLSYDYLVSTDHYGDYNDGATIPYDDNDDGWVADPGNVCGVGGDAACTVTWIAGGEFTGNSNTQAHFGIIGGSRIAVDSLTDITSLNSTMNDFRDADADGDVDAVLIINHPLWQGAQNSWPDLWTEIDQNNQLSYVPASAIEIKNALSSSHATTGFDELTGWQGDNSYTTGTWANMYRAAYRYWDDWREIWAVGADDTHTLDRYTGVLGSGGGFAGWSTTIQSANASFAVADLQAAVDSGNMFVRESKLVSETHTVAPAITAVSVSGNSITVTYASAVNVKWYKAGLTEITEEAETGVTSTTYQATGTERWVMAEATDSNGLRSYTQPFFIMSDTNIASGKTVTVSAGSTASYITDSNGTTTWDSGAAPDATTWFKIDLGENSLVNGVNIVWGTADTFNYKIEFSTDDSNYYTFRHLTFRNDSADTLNIGNAEARYIKVTIPNYATATASGNVIVKDCNVYAAPNADYVLRYVNTVTGDDTARGDSATPWKTVNSSILRSGDKLILQNSIGGTGGTSWSSTQKNGRHNFFRVVYSGLYNGVKNTIKSGGISTDNTEYEDFVIDGLCSTPFTVDGSTSYADAYPRKADNVTLRRIQIPDAATTSTRLLLLTGSTSGASVRNLRIEDSVLYDIDTGGGDATMTTGIYVVNVAGPLYFYNNTVVMRDDDAGASEGRAISIACLSNTCDFTAKNNIFWSDVSSEAASSVTSGTRIATNNNYGADGAIATQWPVIGATDQVVDPLFISTTDFHLQAGSPAVNKGVNVGLTTDFEGTVIKGSPEIGAYERTTYVPWR